MVEVKFKKGLMVVAKEDVDGLGIIVDVFHKEDLLDTSTYWYDDF